MAESSHARAGRMAKRIRTIVAMAIEREIKDRRLELVTITDSRMTGDLHDATIFYTVRGRTIDEEADVDTAAEALERAKGLLRKKVGDDLNVRFTPRLHFELDTVPEASANMERLLARARQRDAELARLKENAQPAGDVDPYRKPTDESDQDPV